MREDYSMIQIEPPKPTKEVLKYLKIRQRLKESIRKRMKKEHSTSLITESSGRIKKLPNDENYGSFFGPSQPFIAKRVIQQSSQHLKSSSAHNQQQKVNERVIQESSQHLKSSSTHNQQQKVNEKQVIAQKLKESRDYSFLFSDDADLPAPTKNPPSQIAAKTKQPGMRNPVHCVLKPLPSKVQQHSSIPKKKSLEQRKVSPEQPKPKMLPKQPVPSSKPQVHKPLQQNPKYSDSQHHRPKNKLGKRRFHDVEDEMDISRLIRSMFNYNPNKFADDDDDHNMESGFDEILREERRSAKIAKKEDKEQLMLIEKEEREQRQRLSKLKKRA